MQNGDFPHFSTIIDWCFSRLEFWGYLGGGDDQESWRWPWSGHRALFINLCDFLGRQSTFLRLNDVRCVHGLFVKHLFWAIKSSFLWSLLWGHWNFPKNLFKLAIKIVPDHGRVQSEKILTTRPCAKSLLIGNKPLPCADRGEPKQCQVVGGFSWEIRQFPWLGLRLA